VALSVGTLLSAVTVGCTPVTTTNSHSGSTPVFGNTSVATPPSTAKVAPTVPADFVVGVIVTEKKCFGSAGCNIRYTIDPQYLSAKPLPDKTTIIFTVSGGDQDQVGNFTIDRSGTATFDRETSISALRRCRPACRCDSGDPRMTNNFEGGHQGRQSSQRGSQLPHQVSPPPDREVSQPQPGRHRAQLGRQ